ncbi:BolA/IbaG family iron-sulfur metabolism protein [Pseudoalteromonas denitrificans]|uniref:Transcriptional regulator, BolA protein family n=1 Tax=Pseudoalteromonas denitrificans DSM 6059 TaxID=1123010 RepID=A0A1I1IGZ0_9GAMM|nr:BolA/IbaG family iron-sulfur metabolism protein [Pseudoalteromonas denitrificans]SFC35579.1 transcriptional regulator, BolA protein family [Pseudoalteromonas denitrificans DSM 6059]
MQMQFQIEEKLMANIACQHLIVTNESHMHSAGTDSHFKVIIVSTEFEGKRLLQRHRAINSVLADELANHIHALALHTYTEHEWTELYEQAPLSPKCAGGSKK